MKKVRDFITDNRILKEGDNVIIGLSGGADSVCLLHILYKLKDEMKLNLHCVHVNHMIRNTAKRDQDFSCELCNTLKIPITVYSIDCKNVSVQNGVSLEEAGRNERYRLFNELGKELFNDNYVIAIAHHKGDVTETLLFNLARGTGINGLASIKSVNNNIVRPLLCVSKEEILDYLKENVLEHMEDETNQNEEYSRNRIRNVIIPEMNSIINKASDHMAQTAFMLEEIEDYLKTETEKAFNLYIEETPNGLLIKNEINECHQAIKKRLIHKTLIESAGRARDISSVQIEVVLELFTLQVGKKRNIIYGITALREYDGVLISTGNEEEENVTEKLSKVSFEEMEWNQSQIIPNEMYTKWFDYDKIYSCPSVRFKEQGDYIYINDRMEKKSLSDYMKNEKIPSHLRNKIPLVADGNHILWIVGYRISAKVKISDETRKVLVARYLDKEK